MRVRIVCYEDVGSWVLGKFARKLAEELALLGVSVDIAKTADPAADINHHIIYLDYKGNVGGLDTLMVTHIDMAGKLVLLKRQLASASAAICMSSDTMRVLAGFGLPGEKLCYILPAHDGEIAPRPHLVGITTRLYPDGRKREDMLVRLCERISPAEFAFSIMGDGWDEVVATLRQKGFSVEYAAQFDRERYQRMISSLDYYLYLGQDEGSMGFIDALAAGIPTIVTPQGYHVDALNGLSYPFDDDRELLAAFELIAHKKRSLIRSVATWTWKDYAVKHLEVWQYLLNQEIPYHLSYQDGLASLVSKEVASLPMKKRLIAVVRLLQGTVRCRLSRRGR